MLFPLLTAPKVSLLLNACVFMCWIYLHAHLCAPDISKRMRACVSLCVCKQIRLWASEIFQKSNACLMPLPCDQRIRGFFHYLWRRNTFGCLPASLCLSLSHSHFAWRERRVLVIRDALKRCAPEKPFNKVEKQCCFGIQESWRLGSSTADSR